MSYVQKDSIAAKAGLRFGDQILQINGQTVAGMLMLSSTAIIYNNDILYTCIIVPGQVGGGGAA